jgi:hypothetical protein
MKKRILAAAALVMLAIALSSPPKSVSELFSGFGDQILEAGALGLGLVGLLIGPGDLWDSARLLSAGLFALGGALGGWRFWIIRDRD